MKNKYETYKQTSTTDLQAPDFGQAHTYRMLSFDIKVSFIQFFISYLK